jgi:hypothetical protein
VQAPELVDVPDLHAGDERLALCAVAGIFRDAFAVPDTIPTPPHTGPARQSRRASDIATSSWRCLSWAKYLNRLDNRDELGGGAAATAQD